MLGVEGSLPELNRALADRIAKGEVDLQTPGLAEHLWQTTMDKLAVDQPNYASYRRELARRMAVRPVIASDAKQSISQHSRDVIGLRFVADPSAIAGEGRGAPHFPSHFGGRFSENAFGPST